MNNTNNGNNSSNDRMQAAERLPSQSISVWDWPVRICHWSLVIAVAGLVITGQQGGEAMEKHALFGYSVLGIVCFRLLWGFVGTATARFSHFLGSPAKVWAYLSLSRDEKAQWIGHSPLAGYSVLLLLALLLAQAMTGLIADDEIAFMGPLAASVPSEWSSLATSYHKNIGKPALLAMIGLHLSAIAYYAIVLRIPLVSAMIFGTREINK